jgi:hypothetical protein
MEWWEKAAGKIEPLVEVAGMALLSPILDACREAGYEALTIERCQLGPGDVRYCFRARRKAGTPEPEGPWWRWSNTGAPDTTGPAIWGIVATALGHRRKVTACTGQIQIECEGLPTGFYDLS